MLSLLFPALCAAAFGNPPADTDGSYLYQPSYQLDKVLRPPARPYVPQPGDIMLATDDQLVWKIGHNLAWTGHPHHSGVVFKRPDGTMAVLEGGPYDTVYNRVLDCLPHLRVYAQRGEIWIRQRKTPLTEEQSACLTEFALGQDGKRFGTFKMCLQMTPIRTRGPLRTYFIGEPRGPDHGARFFCAEMATEALVYCGAIDAKCARPSATYPRDLFMNYSCNPFLNKYFKLEPCWHPPARFTACPIATESTPSHNAELIAPSAVIETKPR